MLCAPKESIAGRLCGFGQRGREVGREGGEREREGQRGRDREGEREGVEGGRVGKLWTAGQIRLTIGFCKEHFLGAQLFVTYCLWLL